MTSVVDLIKADHKAVEELFAKAKNCTSEPDKRHIADKICIELKKHAYAEEAVVYPHLPEDMREHALDEHDEIRSAVDGIESGQGLLDDHLKALEEAVTHHVGEEEESVLPHLEERETAILESLGKEFEEAKQ